MRYLLKNLERVAQKNFIGNLYNQSQLRMQRFIRCAAIQFNLNSNEV